MVQIRVGDIYLDLYQFDPPKLNFAIEDITDTSAKSSFSQEFRIPATANNSEFACRARLDNPGGISNNVLLDRGSADATATANIFVVTLPPL